MTRSPAVKAVDLGDGWRVCVRRDDDVLAELADEWEALYGRCPSATPFQARAWLTGWWSEYGRPGDLRLAVVRHDGELVGLGAFQQGRRLGVPVPVLEPLGTGLSDWTDVLVDPQHEARALDALATGLLSVPGWQVIDLPEVRSSAVALRWAARWPGDARLEAGSVCAEMPARPLADVVAAMSSKTRQSMRRSMRAMDTAGLTEVPVEPAGAAAGVRELLALHEAQWRERGGMNPEHGHPRFARLLTRALPDMIARGQATLTRYVLDGEAVAVNVMLIGPDVVGGYLFGARPELFGRFNVTAMLMRTALDTSADRGVSCFSMLRGRETYKSTWKTVEALNQRLLLGRPGRPHAAAFAAAVRGRTSLVAALRTRAPAVKSAVLKARTYARNPSLLRTELTELAEQLRRRSRG